MKNSILFFLLLISSVFGVQATWTAHSYTGLVLDAETSEPLPFANVVVVGTKNGTVTDLDGRFTLHVEQKTATLEVSYLGYTTQRQKVKASDKSIKIMLSSASVTCDEVVINNSSIAKKREYSKVSESRVAYDMAIAPASGYHGGHPVSPQNVYADQYPVHNTEDYDFIKENRFLEVNQNPLSTFSIDVDAASYSNMRRFVNNGQQPPKDAIRIEEMVNYFNYEYPDPDNKHPFEVITEISDCPWKPENRLLHIGLQGKRIPTDNLPASNLVFLIDASGSMNSANKLPLLKASFKMLVEQLREQDRVAIVVYAGAAGLVLPSTSGANKAAIKSALDRLSAGGSTAGGAGIQLAYKTAREQFVKGGNNRVILATDGDFNVGASSDAALVRMVEKERESGVFLTVMGYGMGNYKDNKMQKLADSGNGNHAYIDNISEAKKVLVNEFGGTLFTIAKDVKIQIEFNPAQVKGYRLIGYENRLLNKEDFNDDKKDAGELGSGHTVTALYEIIPADGKSDYLGSVDELKYQKVAKPKRASGASDELLTIKLRYKQPDGKKSRLIEKAVRDTRVALGNSSNNFRFSAAVAEFGMLLRDSEFKGEATYAQAAQLAHSAKGEDPNGYRAELIRLIEAMQSLAEPQVAGK